MSGLFQDSHPNRTLRGKKGAADPPQVANPGPSQPTTYFLRSEKEIGKSSHRGRKPSRESNTIEDNSMQKTPVGSLMSEMSFGVQSLEDTIASSDSSLSRTNSNVSESSVDASVDANIVVGRKRKAGNPVHPKIIATGHRILSSEHTAGSPISYRSAESPFRAHVRRNSATSSINLSQPITPLKMSPQPESAMPSTPRSASPKSFRLSDEEQSIASDTGSQVIQSSNSEDNDDDTEHKADAMPQLVMPSIAMPTRRPFTQKGKQMGRMKIMVVGARGVGKTSLIQSICRVCEDIVHLDATGIDVSDLAEANVVSNQPTRRILEIGASTKPYPSWWTDFESRRMLLKRKSMGDGVLERNLTFVDTPGFEGERSVQQILQHFKTSMRRTAHMERMHDSELVNMLSGDGGVQIDAVIYLFDPALRSDESSPELDAAQTELLQYLCKWTNVIAVVGRSDTVQADELEARKKQLLAMFEPFSVEPYISCAGQKRTVEDETITKGASEPYAVSSAIGDDPETIDASILMASGYLQPLVPSELSVFVHEFLEPENVARLRHLAATKFLLWRQENLGLHIDLPKQTLKSSPLDPSSPGVTSTGSILDEPSKVLVPHGSSSYFRSTSPSVSESSALSANVTSTSAQALARYNDQTNTSIPFRQVRLAKWAQDLQRSLDNERRRYKQMFANAPSDWTSNAASDSEKAADPNLSLVAAGTSRPAKGRLGGDLGIIDPRDPLGLLAFTQGFKRQGWFALKLAGSCGMIGAVLWWAARNWADLQEFLGVAPSQPPISMSAVPAPTKSWFDDANWRNLLGLER